MHTFLADSTAGTAHDQATSRSGKTVTAADVLKAVQELDLGPADHLIPILERELAGTLRVYARLMPAYRSLNAKKKK